ncbi:MAG TPA: integration host factor subunit alpha [Rhodanobacteraceae bacterium]
MTLTKAAMTQRLSDEVGLNLRESSEFIDAMFDVLRDYLERGWAVRLSGFGNFEVRAKGERPGRNPKTGEAFAVSARRVVVFHAGGKFRQRVDAQARTRAQ